MQCFNEHEWQSQEGFHCPTCGDLGLTDELIADIMPCILADYRKGKTFVAERLKHYMMLASQAYADREAKDAMP